MLVPISCTACDSSNAGAPEKRRYLRKTAYAPESSGKPARRGPALAHQTLKMRKMSESPENMNGCRLDRSNCGNILELRPEQKTVKRNTRIPSESFGQTKCPL